MVAVRAVRMIPVHLMMIGMLTGQSAIAQDTTAVRAVDDSVTISFTDSDLRLVIQAIGRYLTKPVLVTVFEPRRITFETPAPVARTALPNLLRGIVESQNLAFSEDSAFYRIFPVPPPTAQTTAAAAPVMELFVIRLQHARAGDVAATINLLFGGTGQFSGTGFATGTLADELRRDAARVAPGADTARARGTTLAGPVTLVPDEMTNSLLMRASRTDYDLIREAITQVDIRPLQVLIQVLIVEIRRDRAFALGVGARADSINLGGGTTLSGQLLGGGLGSFVLEIMNLASRDIDATIQAAVSRGDARIVSRPVVLASNNRQARILVGAQRPFVQVSRSLPTDAPSRDQVVQYRDVGTKLTVIPTINADGYVSLSIRQEVNAATNETQFDAPVISTREAETTVLVRDSQTVVLGGLRERQQDVFKSGIPVLSSIPVLGGLFGVQDRRTVETELFLFITPRVIRDDETAAREAGKALEQVRDEGVSIENEKEGMP